MCELCRQPYTTLIRAELVGGITLEAEKPEEPPVRLGGEDRPSRRQRLEVFLERFFGTALVL